MLGLSVLKTSFLSLNDKRRARDVTLQGMRRRFAGRTKPQTRWRLRCLPAFYVIETPPLATPNLFTALSYHPKIAVSQVPEPEYWNKHGPSKCPSRSVLWYPNFGLSLEMVNQFLFSKTKTTLCHSIFVNNFQKCWLILKIVQFSDVKIAHKFGEVIVLTLVTWQQGVCNQRDFCTLHCNCVGTDGQYDQN